MKEQTGTGVLPLIATAGFAAVCCLGPAFVGGYAAGASGWFANLGTGEILGLTMLGAVIAYGGLRLWRRGDRPKGSPSREPKRSEGRAT